MASLTKKETLDERVCAAMTSLAEDVVEDVVKMACLMAKHRKSTTLDKGDVKMAFDKRFNL